MKQLFFLRGTSGSGKSTLAASLAEAYKGAMFAADDYFMVDGEYKFNEKLIGKAHAWCIEATEKAFDTCDTVIVHNTSTSNHEVRIYQDIAEKVGAQFVSLVVENRHGNKNIHGVNDEKVKRQSIKLLSNIKVCEGLNYAVKEVVPKAKKDGLEVVKFLSDFSSIDEGLKELDEQYMIKSKKLNGKILLKYHTQADKTPEIVRECRGLILSEADLSVVSAPLEKFGNYLESYAANDIDFSKAKVVEKVDGSCMVLYFDHVNKKWAVQTLGQIEAEETIKGWGKEELNLTWAELFWATFEDYLRVIKSSTVDILKQLDKNVSYVFELCTPYNKVVVKHKFSKLYFLAMRHKKTLRESPIEGHLLYDIFHVPKLFSFDNEKEIMRVCKEELTDQEEGFVVIDENFRRVKMKSHQYVQKHYDSTVVTINSIANIVFQGEEEEYLSLFPEFVGVVDIIKNEVERVGKEIDDLYDSILNSISANPTTKEFALAVNPLPKSYCKMFMFYMFQGKYKNGKDAILTAPSPEIRKHNVDEFLNYSKVRELIEFNKKTGSLKG